MNWEAFWNKRGQLADPFSQVARVSGSDRQTKAILDATVAHIRTLLDLEKTDRLLDMCCGNGMVTAALAEHCNTTVGIDLSASLVENARKTYPAIRFIHADALSLPTVADILAGGSLFSKAHLGFSFQYFETLEKGSRVVANMLSLLKPGGCILLSDIPDRALFFHYYDSPSKLLRLFRQMLYGNNDMGKFWSDDELQLICREHGVSGKKLVQPMHLPYAHYRMDFLIEKPL